MMNDFSSGHKYRGTAFMIKVDGLARTSGSSSRIFNMTFPICLPAAMNLNIEQDFKASSQSYQKGIS